MLRSLPALLALLTLLAPSPAPAIDEADLLPVEEAFALRAEAVTRERIELTWQVAEGYYLYRHRISAAVVAGGFKTHALELPPGLAKHDEFFGDVETYRGRVTAVQTGAAADDADTLTLAVKYQGCADVGVCYPPHTQRIEVALPARADVATVVVAPDFTQLVGGKPAPVSAGPGPLVEALPLPPEEAFGLEAIAASPIELLLRFTPAPGYYLYRDRSSFAVVEGGDGIALAQPQWPAGVEHVDEHFGEVIVYFDQVELPLPLIREDAGQPRELLLEVTFQGCQDEGICYPPMTRSLRLALPAATPEQLAQSQQSAAAPPGDLGAALAEDSRLAAALAGPNRLWTLLTFFGFGLLLAFTPCVFPMIPILSGIIAGAHVTSPRRAFVLSVVYVLSAAVVFTIAGVVAGLAGQNLQALFQQPWILTAFALVFVALAFSMFGFYELQLPTGLQTRLNQWANRQRAGSLLGVAVMGVLSALIVGPCVAPPLAAAVLYIAQSRDPVLGGLALFALALGMGAPLVAFGTAAGKLLPRAGAWMDATKRVFGVIFLGLAVWMLERFLAPVWIMLMAGALAIGCAVYLGALDRLPESASGWRRLWKALGVMLLLVGMIELVGALGGGRDYLAPLKGVFGGPGAHEQELPFRTVKSTADLDAAIAAANAAGQPVLLDFYADWCVACKEMDKYTFPDPDVHAALEQHVLLKADVTANDALDQALMRRFGIVGPPATVFFGLDGEEIRRLRLIGFEPATGFAARARQSRAQP
ncbi:MAG TPA: protein-disulfide reductase DsbD [Xanthomonadaceae bacterium]|nr:protein-disulfide reductase DsbD [Xanthomonadaceae bacterium]